jgi:hypothetical protein
LYTVLWIFDPIEDPFFSALFRTDDEFISVRIILVQLPSVYTLIILYCMR